MSGLEGFHPFLKENGFVLSHLITMAGSGLTLKVFSSLGLNRDMKIIPSNKQTLHSRTQLQGGCFGEMSINIFRRLCQSLYPYERGR